MKLADAFSLIRNGASIKQYDNATGIPITRIETISNRVVDRNKCGYADIFDVGKYQDYVLQDGDILMSHINSVQHLGKTALYNKIDGEVLIHGMNLLVLRPKKKILEPKYAYIALNSLKFLRQLPRITKKSVNQASFSVNDLKQTDIDVPSISKQKEIAHTVMQIDRMIANRQRALSVADELVKSRFVEMFGDPVTNPMGWTEHRLEEYIEFLTSGSRGWSKYFSDDGEIFITIKNVKNNRITLDNVQHVIPPNNVEAQRTKVREGDLLISITADLGRTGVVSREIEKRGAYINQHLTCIRLKQEQINPSYVSYFMESDAGKRQFDAKNQSAVKAGLNFDAIKSLRLLVPPIVLQNEYVSFVKQVDKSKIVIQKNIDMLQILKNKLMQDCFR